MGQPKITFFCELDGPELKQLFSDPETLDWIKRLNATISLGILDFSRERADVVRKMNQEGIPVTAWLLLPREQGYWINLYNAPLVVSRYGQFKIWSGQNLLSWEGIGLEIEPDIQGNEKLAKNPRSIFLKYGPRIFNRQKYRRALVDYQSLVAMIRGDGYFVESYQIPFIVDERKADSTILQKISGIVDVHVDREVLMLYSSFVRGYGPGLIWNYGPDAQAIGIGSTGGGVSIDHGKTNSLPLDWEELHRDLLLASQLTDHVYLFSLEGCVKQGILPKLEKVDWDQGIIRPLSISRRVGQLRRLSRSFLWLGAHPVWVIPPLIGLTWLLLRKKRLQNSVG